MLKLTKKWSLLVFTVSVVLSMISDSSSSPWIHPMLDDITFTDPSSSVNPSLEFDFYRDSCPEAEKIVRFMMQHLHRIQPSIAPAILRLVFHDCFVQGCDASVLLDSIDGVQSEKETIPNLSLRGFDVIDKIKSKIESVCPGTVSCADILVLAARESVVLGGGPFYPLHTGRRDSPLSYPDISLLDLPAPTDELSVILMKFLTKGFNERETVSLLGSHSIGVIHCRFFQDRLFNFSGSGQADPSLETGFLNQMRSRCNSSDSTEDPTMSLERDGASELGFGTHYYRSLTQNRGILQADQQLMTEERTASWVRAYASDGFMFHRDFSSAMMRLSNLGVLTGSLGEIRINCSSTLIDD
ncbi:Plant peroxidase [Macleaya cordata]|uniref:Peroxidase n=1 Tax=Macleaya cordata TaxID=56857 RepID=A0A200RCA7_MACCD|nr:Plant peroxidase [Macleaya cordata]